MAADLVRRQVAVIVAIGTPTPAQAAKAVTSTIPIVFAMGGDAIDSGLVTSLNRPEANVTGMSFATAQLAPKRLELLRELVPQVTLIGYLVNSRLSPSAEPVTRDLVAAALTIGRKIVVLEASTEQEIDTAFATMVQLRVGALVVSPDAFFFSRRNKVVALAARHAVPAIYALREYAAAGGLMSYGAVISDMYRQAGIYTGRILKGEKPADLPVQAPTKYELVVNLKTAKALGLELPATLLARANEVIE
jgi:putative ABC transport system substrate-binding protein